MRSLLTEGDIKKLKKKYSSKIDQEAFKTTGTNDPPPDDRLSAISKLIPAEAVTIFLGTIGYLKLALATTPVAWISLGLFVFCLIIAIAITYFKASDDKVTLPGIPTPVEIPQKYLKTALTAAAFVIWAFNIENFITYVQSAFPNYDPTFGGIILIIYTMLIPDVYGWFSKKGT